MEDIRSLADKLIAMRIPYAYWTGGATQLREPMWAENAPFPDTILAANCAGLLNLILRYLGKSLPESSPNDEYRGGTAAYYNYYSSVRRDFDVNTEYPDGTLVGRNYRNTIDQGHVAIILDGKVFQSTPGYGVNALFTLEESHVAFEGYEYCVYPEDWLL